MKHILLLLSLTTLMACADVERQETEIMHEKAVVVTLIHSPSQHNVELTQTAYKTNNHIGTDYNGNTGLSIGDGVQLTTSTIPERFGVAFQCQHGTFTVEGDKIKHKVLYDKLYGRMRDTVDILYKENYLLTYETENKVRVLKKKELIKIDFVDAQ